MFDEQVTIISNEPIAPSLHIVELAAPQIASCAEPGQFVHLRIPDFEGHVLRRPFSIYRWDGGSGTISIMYQTVGAGSDRLAELKRTKAPAVLIETAFHDNPEDAGWIKDNIETIARSLSQSVAQFLNVPFVDID